MIKYIDTNKIEIPEGFFNDLNVTKFFQLVNNLPTVDLVDVVRCKDCIHRDPEDKKCDGTFQAKCGMFPMEDDDFCSYGKKMGGKE